MWAEDDGFGREFYPSTSNIASSTRVTVEPEANTSGIDFTLDPEGLIAGTVYETDGTTPVAGANVFVQPYDAPWPSFGGGTIGARTDGGGYYEIDGLGGGDYLVVAVASESGLALEFYSSTYDTALATRVTVVSGATSTDVDFSLNPGGFISGTVLESDASTTIEFVSVRIAESSTDVVLGFGFFESPGTYISSPLPASDYIVWAYDSFGRGCVLEYWDNVSNKGSATPVTVTVPGNTGGIDFTLDQTP